jgi:adenylate cyclase
LAGSIRAVLEWLIAGAPTARRPEDVLAELCARFLACGLPLHRVAVFVRTLHPNVMGRRFLWRPDREVEVSERPHGFLEEQSYLASPIALVFAGGGTVRRRLADPECPNDFGIIDELRAEGVADYLIQPLAFSNGEIHAVSWTTTRPGGFSDAEVAALEAIAPPLARVAEIHALRRIASTLLSTYVGPGTGRRILEGRIRRGDLERIQAVILLADLRGFTALSDRLPGDRVIALLNSYFDAVVPALEAAGGEVLKFMGDGVLAIFPIADQPADACGRALAAVTAARTALAELNAARRAQDEDELRWGVALHQGEVLYGNIGSSGRLDFTAIGPAVNLTARLESLTRDLGRDLVLSAAFAAHAPASLASLGRFELRGFRDPVEVYAPRAG